MKDPWMSDIKLYGYATSPYVRKVGAFLYYKQLPFEHVPVSPISPQETIAFTGGTQVPVLKIGEEWRLDSSPIGFWLDELYPERPLLPADPALKQKILEIDDWISETFLLSIFRGAIDAPDNLAFRNAGWRLAALLSAHTPLPEKIRHEWPNLLRKAPFIKAMAPRMNLEEPYAEMQARIGMELIGHLGEGPFLGGSPEPTMADMAVYPQLLFYYMAGLQEDLQAAKIPVLRDWIGRVAPYLPENPTLVHDDFIIKTLSDLD